MRIENYSETVELPEKVSAQVADGMVTVKGPKGELSRSFRNPKIAVATEGGEVKFTAALFTKKEKTQLGTFIAHLKNMLKGVTEGHEYTLKVCSGHFPMNVTCTNNQLIVKNFLGEKVPRILRLGTSVKVIVEGDKITVQSISKDGAAQTAASMELLTRRTSFDKRIFQDGIYIVNKDGKEIA
jgi:large subunit ribosomal protein L6